MIAFEVRDRDDESYNPKAHYAGEFTTRTVRRTGVLYEIAGEMVELFTIRVMAEAIDRRFFTVIEWERGGHFPRPLFKLPTRPKTRFYSGTQILNIHRIALHRYQFRKSSTFDLKAFSKDVKAVFFQPSIVIDEKGALIKENFHR